MSAFISAPEARKLSLQRHVTAHKVSIYDLKDRIDKAISLAIVGGLTQASVIAPEETEEMVLKALINVLKKLGYRAKLDYNRGYFAPGFLQSPTTTITIAW